MTKFFVKKPYFVLVTVIIVLVVGFVSLGEMQTDLLPELELPYMAECDGLVIGSPVYYSGIAGTMKSFLDRFFYCGGGQLCAYKPVAGVVALRRSGGVDAFHQMNNYFNLANALIVPSFYWNAIHGMRPGEAQQDMEGIQIMENIGRNMAWMLKTLEYSRAAVPLPEKYPRTSTNFIR